MITGYKKKKALITTGGVCRVMSAIAQVISYNQKGRPPLAGIPALFKCMFCANSLRLLKNQELAQAEHEIISSLNIRMH